MSGPADKYEGVIPALAATLMLVRDGAAGIEVLMVTRHGEAGFAAGAMVFPGGRLEPGDADMLAFSAPVDDSPEQQSLRVAAIRETYEECGILLARQGDALLSGAALDALRPSLVQGAFAQSGVTFATDLLARFAHWITPPGGPRRFDTHFFLAPAPAGQVAAHDGAEMVDSIWMTPTAVMEAADRKEARVMFPTYMNLSKLGRSRTVAEAMEAARAAEVVTVSPVMVETSAGRVMRIPAEAGYDRTDMPVGKLATSRG